MKKPHSHTLFILMLLFSVSLHSQRWEWALPLAGNKVEYFVDISHNRSTSITYGVGNFFDTLTFNNYQITNPWVPFMGDTLPSMFICAVNSDGQVLWSKVLYGYNVKASSITVYKNKIYATGSYVDTLFVDNDTLSTLSNANGYGLDESIFLICLDSLGNIQYVRDYGYSAGYYPEAIAVNDSGIFISGVFSEVLIYNNDTINPPVLPDLFLTKIDFNGNRTWTKYAGRYYSRRYTRESQLVTDSAENIYVSGHYQTSMFYGSSSIFGSNAFLMKFTSSGNILSLSNFCTGDSIELYDATLFNDSIYYSGTALSPVIIGSDTVSLTAGGNKAFLTKFDTSLNVLTNIIVQENNTKSNALSSDLSGNIYWSVYFDSSLTILNNTTVNYTIGMHNNAVIKLTNDTSIRYERLISGQQFYIGASSVDYLGNYYIGGYNNNTQLFDTLSTMFSGINDGFLAKISCKPAQPEIFTNDTFMCWNATKDLWVTPYSSYITPLWSNNAISSTINVDTSGNYTCVFVDENGCMSDTASIMLYQYPKTTVSINRLCDSLYVDFPKKGEWWYNGSYITTSNGITANNEGWYQYVNSDSNNCLTVDSIWYSQQNYQPEITLTCDSLASVSGNGITIWYMDSTVVDSGRYYIVSQDGSYFYVLTDSLGCTWASDTINVSVSDFTKRINIYPNPIVESVYIEGVEDAVIAIYNLLGKIEFDTQITTNKNKEKQRCTSYNDIQKINLSFLSKGIYIIKIEANGYIWSEKIIKQ